MKIKINLSLLLVILAGGLLAFYFFIYHPALSQKQAVKSVEALPKDREVTVKIESNMTFSTITASVGIDGNLMTELLAAAEPVYDLVRIKTNKPIRFTFDQATDTLKEVMYQIDTESELYIIKNNDKWQAEVKDIDYEIKIKTVSGKIDTSFYESALAQNIDERTIIALADVFAWSIDFAMGVKQGDTYKFIYEERYRDGQYVMPGKIIAASFNNDGKIIEGYYFSEGQDKDGELIEGYYDASGASLQKIFLKNPVDFKYITSGFTTGLRYISAFNISTGHRAIDYAANIGTPIRAVGDGTVVYAGWSNQGYGNLTSIRHNSVYTTNYGHQSKIYVKIGQKVKQGQVIGAVGSTGLSTGPHLHFEMVKNGTKINPLTVDLPSDKSIAPENLENFKQVIVVWQEQLKNE
jgi:murein DD-endopeptidase MepM/ murein hydrolase activator NlpD